MTEREVALRMTPFHQAKRWTLTCHGVGGRVFLPPEALSSVGRRESNVLVLPSVRGQVSKGFVFYDSRAAARRAIYDVADRWTGVEVVQVTIDVEVVP
jgi:hypothetical protein